MWRGAMLLFFFDIVLVVFLYLPHSFYCVHVGFDVVVVCVYVYLCFSTFLEEGKILLL